MKKINFPWGSLLVARVTKKTSVGIDIIKPHKQTDNANTYLKRGAAIYYIIYGKGKCGEKLIKEGDLLKIEAGQKINIENTGNNNLEVITIYRPPYSEKNISKN
jgi:mannose-6-phosphate isomerase-like protein (cupin superfamily)